MTENGRKGESRFLAALGMEIQKSKGRIQKRVLPLRQAQGQDDKFILSSDEKQLRDGEGEDGDVVFLAEGYGGVGYFIGGKEG